MTAPTVLHTLSAEGIERLLEIVSAADRAIMDVYARDFSVERKHDASPVTEADTAAHAVIVAGLSESWPNVPIISEEGELPSAELRGTWERYWLVDPLDGTKEFINRNGEFTVNVALMEHGVPVAGVVSAPAIGVRYWAARGLGAWRTVGDGKPQRIESRVVSERDALVVVESRSHPSAELEQWLSGVRVSQRVKAGSSLKLCWVADGQADVYPRFGPTMAWDVAAGDCVFRNSTRDGSERPSPLRYDAPDLRNGSFILGL